MSRASLCFRLLIIAGAILTACSKPKLAIGDEPKPVTAIPSQEPAQQILQRQFYARTIELAWQAWQRGEITRARKLLQNTDPELRSWEYDYLLREFGASETLFELPWVNTPTGIRYVTFSPNGSLLAACSDDLKVRVWDLDSSQLLYDVHDETRTVEFNSTGNALITGLSSCVTIRDSRSGMVVDRLGVPDSGVAGIPLTVQFSADDSIVAVQHTHHGISVLDSVSAQERFRFQDRQITTQFRFHPLEQKLAVATRVWNDDVEHRLQCGIELYELSGQKPRLIQTIDLHYLHSLRSLAFSHNGLRLAVCGSLFNGTGLGECAVFDTESGSLLFGLRDLRSNPACVRFSADGQLLATGSLDGSIHLWNGEDGCQIDTFRGHTGPVKSVAFSPDGRTLASGSADGTVRLWKIQRRHRGNRPRIQLQFTPDLSLTDNGERTYTLWGRYDQEAKAHYSEVRISATTTGQQQRSVQSAPGTEIIQIAESHDSRLRAQSLRPIANQAGTPAASSNLPQESSAGVVQIIDQTSGEQISEIRCEPPAQRIAFSPDDRFLYTASAPARDRQHAYSDRIVPKEFELARWEVATGNPLFRQTVDLGSARGQGFRRLAVSPDGSLLAVAVVISPKVNEWKSVIYLFDAQTGKPSGELVEPETMSIDFQFSPDARRLAAAVQKSYKHQFRGYVSVWDLKRQQKTLTIAAHQSHSHAVSFTPDGRRVVSAGASNDYEGGEISFWDTETGERVLQLDDFSSSVLRLAFDPADRTLAAVERSGKIILLNAD